MGWDYFCVLYFKMPRRSTKKPTKFRSISTLQPRGVNVMRLAKMIYWSQESGGRKITWNEARKIASYELQGRELYTGKFPRRKYNYKYRKAEVEKERQRTNEEYRTGKRVR
jgi:hypothetical protein